MREDVFKEYYKRMVGIINYKETDANGNERKCTVSVAEAKKHPEQYKIYTCKLSALKGKQFAYDPELVKKQADILREICGMVPQKKLGLSYDIWLKSLLQDNSKPQAKEALLGETFLAMAKECGIMRAVRGSENYPDAICRNSKRRYSINL